MAEEQKGVKETKEALVGAIKLGKFVAERLKDGAGFDDAMALGTKLLNPEFRKMVNEAVQGADQIPAEAKDLSLDEGAELIEAVLSAWNEAA
jgi:hypothetical protein